MDAPTVASIRMCSFVKASMMTRQVRLGMLTPSSNTALEPITRAMLAGIADVSVHFSRF